MRQVILTLYVALASFGAWGDPVQTASLAVMSELFPEGDHLESRGAKNPVQAVFAGDDLLGYALYTDDVFPIPAYSGKPIRALVGIDPNGNLVGVRIIHHEEPILVIGISDEDLATFIDQYHGISIGDKVKLGRQVREGYRNLDGISGATITTMVLHRSIMQSARQVVMEQEDQFHDLPIEDPAPWIANWEENIWYVAILLLGLSVLVVILLFQDWVVVHPEIFKILRLGFLIYTVVFIGFICLAQLSIINVLTFGQVLARGFRWDTFLVDPIIFALWGFVAITILLWGRGVYCGWLCPFGAVQELIYKLSARLNIRQIEFSRIVHERLLAIKYVILIALIGISLHSIASVVTFVEVEPFKTVFSLRFNREWTYVAYPLILFGIAFFNAKFYCKYLCPLGAALSFGTNFKIFDWLRRRPECGSPCHTCANECSVGAVSNTGEIIENECHYCLECQATYWDEYKCPPMVAKRERRERRERRTEIIPTTDAS